MTKDIMMKEYPKLRCQRCKHVWVYTGDNNWFAVCPHCKTTVSLGINRIGYEKMPVVRRRSRRSREEKIEMVKRIAKGEYKNVEEELQ